MAVGQRARNPVIPSATEDVARSRPTTEMLAAFGMPRIMGGGRFAAGGWRLAAGG
ncbi:MAG: hypothetical protein AVDCRST_MAG73-381 [uncultured Thermomicrobiales bacterium]|uniref:Uncharacterized protein n=1 Tax=uncultured Thermomicrobiales bacterium TaxID=1645740 RepID=A0A6J4TKJ5_9BACT|nr:MAG: hypothetical protein AVDCRST_MAG73-381 [uncultured Thermomicrobiales bacterium]